MRHFLTFAMVCWAGTAVAQDDDDRSFITGLIEDTVSNDNMTVRLINFQGALSSEATADGITISDPDGVWLQLDGLIIDWNRSALLRGRVEIEKLGAERIELIRLPNAPEGVELPDAEATPFALPDLPVSIDIVDVSATEIVLTEELLGEPLAAQFQGALSLIGGEAEADIVLERTDEKTGRFDIELSYDDDDRDLALMLLAEEGQDGIAARMLGLPDTPALKLEITGDAPLEDFTAQIALATDGVYRVSGTASVAQSDDTEDQIFGLDLTGDLRPFLEAQYDDFFGANTILKVEGTSFAEGGLSVSNLTVAADQVVLRGAVLLDANGWPETIDLRGRLGSGTGAPVILPISGMETQVQSMALNVQYDAAIGDAWTGAFDITEISQEGVSLGTLNISGDGMIVPAEGGTAGRFSASLDYAARGIALDNEALARALGEDLVGSVSIARVEDGPLAIRDLTITGAGLFVEGDAQIDGTDERFLTTANLSVEADDFTRFAAISGFDDLAGAGAVRLRGDVQPFDGIFDLTVNAQTTDLALGIDQLDPALTGSTVASVRVIRDTTGTEFQRIRLANEALIAQGSGKIGSGTTQADFTADINDLSVIDASLSGPANMDVQMSTDAQNVITFDADVTAPDVSISAQGTATALEEEGYDLAGQLDVLVNDLNTYSDLAGQDIDGRVELDLDGTYNTANGVLDADLDARTQDVVAGDGMLGDIINPTLTGAATLQGTVSRNLEGAITLDTEFAAPIGFADLDGTATPVGTGYTVSGEGVVTVNDLAPYSALAGEELSGRVSVDLDGSYTTTTGIGNADLIAQTQDVRFGNGDSTLSNVITPTLTGAATVQGTVSRDAQGVITLDTDFAAPIGSVDINGTATPVDDGYTISGDGSVAVNDLGAYSALTGGDLGGSVSLDVDGSYTTTTGVVNADLTARTQNLTAGSDAIDRALSPSLSGDAILNATVSTDATGVVTLDTDFTAPSIDADVQGTATPRNGGYILSGEGEIAVDELSPYSDLAGRPIGGGISVNLDGDFNTNTNELNTDVVARTRDLRAGIDALDRIIAGLGRISATVGLSEAGRLRLDAIDVVFPNLTASGAVSSSGNDTTADLTARLRDVAILAPDFSGPLVADVAARQDAGGWQITGDATGPLQTNARATGRVENSGNLDLRVTGSAPLSVANLYIAPRQVNGLASFDLAIQGPPALNSVRGPITLSDARFVAPTVQLALENIGGTINLAGGTARLDVTGSSTEGGTLNVSGPVDLSAPFQAAIAVNIADFVLRDPSLYRTTADGQVNVNGALAGGAAISGQINIGDTEVQVPSTGISALGSLPEVTHLGIPTRVRETLARADIGVTAPTQTTAAAAGPGYPIDLTISAPSRIFIRGRGLDAELGGELVLTGNTNNIIPIGRFDLIRGRLSILGQRFDLDEGFAQLQGDFTPFLRLVATTETRTGVIISTIIEGPASDIEVSFESTPDLPQDEVLAQLLFGRDLSSISPFQAVQLASAVSTLAGDGDGGVVAQLRQGLNLDDLDIVTDAEGNTGVRAGRYISERVYTDVTVGAGSSTEINLNFDITDSITARGSATSDGDTSVGVFFERDY